MKREELRRLVDEAADFINSRVRTASAALEEVADHLVNTLAPGQARKVFEARSFGHPVLTELKARAEKSVQLSATTLERLFWVGIYNEVYAGEPWANVPLGKKYVLLELKAPAKFSEGVALGLRGKVSVRTLAEWVARANEESGITRRQPRIGTRNVHGLVKVGSQLDERQSLDGLVDAILERPAAEQEAIEAGLKKTEAGARRLLAELKKKKRSRR